MPFNLLLLPLLGGYWFVALAYPFKFVFARQSGQRMIASAATAGIFLGLLALTVRSLILHFYPDIADALKVLFPWEYSGTALVAIIMGPLFAVVVNFICGPESAEKWAVEQVGNDLDRLFSLATTGPNHKPVQLTLEDQKVYIGWVQHTGQRPNDPGSYVRILPIVSGYRDSQQLVHLTTWYTSVYAQMLQDDTISDDELVRLTDFLKVIPVARLTSAGLFDFVAHETFEQSIGGSRKSPIIAKIEF